MSKTRFVSFDWGRIEIRPNLKHLKALIETELDLAKTRFESIQNDKTDRQYLSTVEEDLLWWGWHYLQN